MQAGRSFEAHLEAERGHCRHVFRGLEQLQGTLRRELLSLCPSSVVRPQS